MPVPAPIALPDGTILHTFMPMAGVPKVRPVYSALLPNNDHVVVKLGGLRDVQHEVACAMFSMRHLY